VNAGISVSRVGGSAQIAGMKKIAGGLRLSLASYRALAAFAQFGSDLDKATQDQLARGQRLVEVLKQAQYAPLRVERQIVVIYAGTNGFLDDVDVSEIRPFEADMYRYLEVHHRDLLADIAQKGALDDGIKERIGKALDAFKAEFKASRISVK
jgi:F-type H+-transporting ATPase subunit alpha